MVIALIGRSRLLDEDAWYRLEILSPRLVGRYIDIQSNESGMSMFPVMRHSECGCLSSSIPGMRYYRSFQP